MKKILTKAGILSVGLYTWSDSFSSLMNKETTDNKMDLEEATLPVMSMKIGGEKRTLCMDMLADAGGFMREV